MTLTRRLILGTLTVIGAFVVLTVVSLDRRLRARLREDITAELLREARLVGVEWRPGLDADSLANVAGHALSHRVTLILADGTVIGDSEFDPPALGRLENHSGRPEVRQAVEHGEGSSVRVSPSAGDEELYAAVKVTLGVARVSVSTRSQELLVQRMQKDALTVAMIGVAFAVVLAVLFARSVARPILELRDDAQAIAGGDLARRPSLVAPGEVGELASALHRLAEELTARLGALEADDALLRALTESLNEGVLAIDRGRLVVHLNEQGRRLLGVRGAVPLSADALPRDRVVREAIEAAFHGDTTESVEVQLGERLVALTARPLATGGAVLALFDLTRLRRLEAVRRDFVANVSHELKTPLTVVRGFAETLEDPSLPEGDRQRFAAAILGNTQRMQRIVDDLLDLSRIESGGWSPNPAVTPIESVAAEVLTVARPSAEAKGVSLRTEIDPNASSAFVDPTAMRQILGNLVENAVRHTSAGEVVIFAWHDNGSVVLGVRDTGSGIPRDALPRIFERFYRVDAARSRENGGTGLGLAIVKHLAEAHGGTARAASEIGKGTTVEVVLPDPLPPARP